jgi:ArsR family transcriptional regulator
MKLLAIYRCLCDETRLRILHLLSIKPLCVCHFQEVLGEPQVKISKHLAYLKAQGMVESRRYQNWMIYSLPRKKSPELDSNLRCLQDCVGTEPIFKKDLRGLAKIKTDCSGLKAEIKGIQPSRATTCSC